MSFNSPFFDFFDAINSEVDSFNRALGSYNAPRRALPSHRKGKKSSNRRELQRGNNNYGALTAPDWDPFLDEEEELGLIPASDATFPITPPVDLLEHDKDYELSVPIPGLKSKNSVNVDYHRDTNQLEISGEVPPVVTEENRGKVKRQEVRSGSFRRVLPLPKYPGVEADKIKADYSSGVLKVDIPKLTPTGPKEGVHRIDVGFND